jgi:hypothetical protein
MQNTLFLGYITHLKNRVFQESNILLSEEGAKTKQAGKSRLFCQLM